MNKKIGLFGAVATGVGMIIATSCFIPLAAGASTVGTAFAFSIVFVCFINMLAAASFAELNALMPNLTGGLAQYTLVGLGPFVTIITMVGGYFISNVFAAPAEGAMFANVMVEFLGDDLPASFYSVTLTIFLIAVNCRGVNLSTQLQCVIAAIMVSSLLALGLIGAFGLGTEPQVTQELVLPDAFDNMFPLMTTAFWLFIGSEFIIPLGKDMENPKRDIPRAMILSLGIMCVIQVLMVIGFGNYTIWTEAGASNSPHILYAVGMLGDIGRWWIIVVAILAAVSTQNSIISSVSEICCGMAKIGLLPAVFQRKNRHNAPYVVILLLGIITIFIEAMDLTSGEAIYFLIMVSSLFMMISYTVSHINVISLRSRMRTVPRSFKVPGYPFLQILGVVATVYMMYNISMDPVERIEIFELSFALLALLTAYAFFWVKVHMHMPIFRREKMNKVMAMEDPLYYISRHQP